jgi:uncharacterized protein with GYD domain
MPTYVVLHNFTDQGKRTVRETIQRANGAAELAQQKYGCSLQTYWTVGSYDVVYILEAPDDGSAAAFFLDVGSRGVVRTTTLRAYNREEMSIPSASSSCHSPSPSVCSLDSLSRSPKARSCSLSRSSSTVAAPPAPLTATARLRG